MNNSGMNTVLLVIIIALIGGAAWYFLIETKQESGMQVEINLPAGDSN